MKYFKIMIEKLKKILIEDDEIVFYNLPEHVKNWPNIPERTGSTEELDMENCEFLEINDKDFTIMCGGDWQPQYIVKIKLVNNGLIVDSYQEVDQDDEYPSDDDYIDMYELLGVDLD